MALIYHYTTMTSYYTQAIYEGVGRLAFQLAEFALKITTRPYRFH